MSVEKIEEESLREINFVEVKVKEEIEKKEEILDLNEAHSSHKSGTERLTQDHPVKKKLGNSDEKMLLCDHSANFSKGGGSSSGLHQEQKCMENEKTETTSTYHSCKCNILATYLDSKDGADCPVINMAPQQEKAFCVLQYHTTKSVITVQRQFRRNYKRNPPSGHSIRKWYRKMIDTGCICKGKSTGRPATSAATVERVRESFRCSPTKSTHRASRELNLPQPTVWKVLRKRLALHPS